MSLERKIENMRRLEEICHKHIDSLVDVVDGEYPQRVVPLVSVLFYVSMLRRTLESDRENGSEHGVEAAKYNMF